MYPSLLFLRDILMSVSWHSNWDTSAYQSGL